MGIWLVVRPVNGGALGVPLITSSVGFPGCGPGRYTEIGHLHLALHVEPNKVTVSLHRNGRSCGFNTRSQGCRFLAMSYIQKTVKLNKEFIYITVSCVKYNLFHSIINNGCSVNKLQFCSTTSPLYWWLQAIDSVKNSGLSGRRLPTLKKRRNEKREKGKRWT